MRNSVPFWLVAMIGAGIIFIESRFLVVPLAAAAGFEVTADGMPTMAYLGRKERVTSCRVCSCSCSSR